jgi:acetolactate synthase-1/2/3 large subunit
VVLMVPQDLLTEPMKEMPAAGRRASLGTYPLDRCSADPALVEHAARLLATARAPLIVAGGGVHLSGAHDALASLQHSAGIPVATTVMGKGAVDETHPLSLGVIGYFMGTRSRTRHLRALVDQADVILLVGTRTNQNGTDSWSLFPKTARFIHVDVDGLEVGRNYESLRLVGDARLVLHQLSQALAVQDLTTRRQSTAGVEKAIAAGHAAYRAEAAAHLASASAPLRPERLMQELDAVLTPDSVVVSDASYAPIWAANFLTARRAGMRFLAGRGLAGLGWGFPAALGAKLATPAQEVFCLTGDGGFAHMWSELETAKRMGIKVTVIVLNNQILGYQWHAEDVLYGGHTDACQLSPVDHAAIARACGCNGIRVEAAEAFAPALQAALASDTTTVIDVVTDPRAFPPITLFEGKLEG